MWQIHAGKAIERKFFFQTKSDNNQTNDDHLFFFLLHFIRGFFVFRYVSRWKTNEPRYYFLEWTNGLSLIHMWKIMKKKMDASKTIKPSNDYRIELDVKKKNKIDQETKKYSSVIGEEKLSFIRHNVQLCCWSKSPSPSRNYY